MAVPHCSGEEQVSAQDQLQQRRGPAAPPHAAGLTESHDFSPRLRLHNVDSEFTDIFTQGYLNWRKNLS
jgi:hypothetical protein